MYSIVVSSRRLAIILGGGERVQAFRRIRAQALGGAHRRCTWPSPGRALRAAGAGVRSPLQQPATPAHARACPASVTTALSSAALGGKAASMSSHVRSGKCNGAVGEATPGRHYLLGVQAGSENALFVDRGKIGRGGSHRGHWRAGGYSPARGCLIAGLWLGGALTSDRS